MQLTRNGFWLSGKPHQILAKLSELQKEYLFVRDYLLHNLH